MQTHYLTNSQKDIEKIDLYAKDPYEEKYQCLINIHEGVDLKYWNDSSTYVEYLRDMVDVYYKSIDE